MSQTKILVDSCSYFRLAQNVHPLLAVSFGEANYTLYAHEELTEEFSRTPRLQTKFSWVLQKDYAENLSRPLLIGRKEKKEIAKVFEFMWEHVVDENLGPSRVDVRILATASELQLRMVTDDCDLLDLAEQYGVHAMTSLELLQLMIQEEHIDMDKVRQVAAQWIYDKECPSKFFGDYCRLFGEKPPKE